MQAQHAGTASDRDEGAAIQVIHPGDDATVKYAGEDVVHSPPTGIGYWRHDERSVTWDEDVRDAISHFDGRSLRDVLALNCVPQI